MSHPPPAFHAVTFMHDALQLLFTGGLCSLASALDAVDSAAVMPVAALRGICTHSSTCTVT